MADASPPGVTRVAASPVEVGLLERDALVAFDAAIGQNTLMQLNVPEAELPEVARLLPDQVRRCMVPGRPERRHLKDASEGIRAIGEDLDTVALIRLTGGGITKS